MSSLSYKIITPERVVLEGEAKAVTAMTSEGEITVLPGHVPLVALLKAGEMRVQNPNGANELLAVSTGMLEVQASNRIVILADSAERSEELELAQIEIAKKKAEETLLAARNQDEVAFADAAAHLEKELARYRVALKKGKAKI
jgi:F-type H+-transporting ATPase subunit epsilon